MTIVVTSETGGTAQPGEAVYVPPDRQVRDAGATTVLAGTGLDAAFVSDLLSACLAHERCGAHLYRSVAGRTADAELRAQYEHFGEETREHVERLEQLIAGADGDPQYVSASARATEKADAGVLESTYLLGGSLDPMTAELVMLEAVMLAEAKDHSNWELLAQLASTMTDGGLRRLMQTVTAEVLAQEEEHYRWAHDTRARLLLSLAGADSVTPRSAPDTARVDDRTRDELYTQAQELDIPGRSRMTKEELQTAVEEQEGETVMNPLEQKGIAVEDQFRSWSELNVAPYDKLDVHPYTRTRVILMNGVEVESIMFSHQFARHTDNLEIKQALALSRRVDAQQQKVVNGLNPGDQTPLETTIGYEQVAVDLTAWLARHEPDPMLKQALDFALLEDFDHLYRYANLYELLDGKNATELTDQLTEITPGRPTIVEHRHPHDDVRGHFETHTVDPLSRMHVMTIVAAEQQTMNFYMNHGADWVEPIARGLYAEIALIEEQHVTHYESLLDPLDSWLKQLVFHEYNEAYLYWSMLQNEEDRRIKSIWELHLDMEIGQLHAACDLLRRYEGIEPEAILPAAMPDTPVTFEPNKDYVREILATQIDLRADGLDYVADDALPSTHRSRRYRDVVNASGAPSEMVIDDNRAHSGHEFRDETEGEHPVVGLRA